MSVFQLIIAFIIFTPSFGWSALIEGELVFIKHFPHLRVSDSPPLALKTKSDLIAKSLLNLNEGDFLSGEGTLNITDQSIELHAIKYIGLTYILGPWVSSSGEYFIFKDYHTLEYISGHDPLHPDVSRTRSIIYYHIGPINTDFSWPFLFTDNLSSGSGHIIFSNGQIRIILSVSGQKSREFILSPGLYR